MSGGIDVRVVKSVDTDAVFGGAIAKFFDALAKAAAVEVMQEGRVPIDTSALEESLRPGAGVTESGGSMAEGYYAQVGSNVAVYPSVLEQSPRYHYLRGPSQGAETLGWLTKVIPAMEPEIERLAAQCTADIQAGWSG